MLLNFGQSLILTWILRTEPLCIFCLLPCKFFILCCSVLYHLQGKGFWTRNRFAHRDLGCGGNISSFYPTNRAGRSPPAALRGGGLPLQVDNGKHLFSSARMCKVEYLVEIQDLPFRHLDMSTPACHYIPLVDLVIWYLVSWVAFCTSTLQIPCIRNIFFLLKNWFPLLCDSWQCDSWEQWGILFLHKITHCSERTIKEESSEK